MSSIYNLTLTKKVIILRTRYKIWEKHGRR